MEVSRPRVIIIGGGIAGLVLAICLERASIPYCVYERAQEIKPLGSAIYLPANVAPVLIQLGLYDDLMRVSKTAGTSWIRRENMEVASEIDFAAVSNRFGYPGMTMTRFDLYRILLSRIPSEKMLLGKRLLSLTQSESNGTLVKFADGTTVRGDIVCGADGAYSATRQCIYAELKEKNELPNSDMLPLQATSSCLVGVTTVPIDPSLYPPLSGPTRTTDFVMADTAPYVWVLFTMPENKIAFMILKDIKTKNTEIEMFKASQWSSETALDFANQVRDFKTPYGGKLCTLGGIFDKTDSKTMSKVILEQKLFKTWYHGRVVLIGDAAHKMTPHSGQGATQSIFDCVSLSNFLNDLEFNTPDGYLKAFKAYKDERFEFAKLAVNASNNLEALTSGKGTIARFAQQIVFNWIPESVTVKKDNELYGRKPQLTYLPFVEERGQVKNPMILKQSTRMAPSSQWASAPVTL